MIQPTHMPLIIQVQCCQHCYLHPEQKHSESQYVLNLSQLQEQTQRIWHSSAVEIIKNKQRKRLGIKNKENERLQAKLRANLRQIINLSKNKENGNKNRNGHYIERDNNQIKSKSKLKREIKPRINSFEVRYRSVLVFSKLNYGKFCSHKELANIILQLTARSQFDIQKLVVKLEQNDVFSILKEKRQKYKISLKFLRQQIDNIIEKLPQQYRKMPVSIQRREINCINLQKQSAIAQNQETGDQLLKLQQYQGSASCSMPRSSNTSKYSFTNATLDPLRRTSKNSIFESKLGNRSVKLSSMGHAHQNAQNKIDIKKNKKCYFLSKEVDVEGVQCQDIDFQLLEVSSDDDNENKDKIYTEQDLKKLRIAQGLNSRLFSLLPAKTENQGRKYSSDIKRLSEMLQLQMQLQSGQNNTTIKQSRFFQRNTNLELDKQKFEQKGQLSLTGMKLQQNQRSKLHISENNESDVSNSNIYTEGEHMLFEIDQKDLVSKRDLWKQIRAEIDDEKQQLQRKSSHTEKSVKNLMINSLVKKQQKQIRQQQEQSCEKEVKRSAEEEDCGEKFNVGEVSQIITEVFQEVVNQIVGRSVQSCIIHQSCPQQSQPVCPQQSQSIIQQQSQSVCPQQSEPIIQQQSQQLTQLINYVTNHAHPRIKQQDIPHQSVQICIDTQFIHKLIPLSTLILYLHSQSPTLFPFLLHNPSLTSIYLSFYPSKSILTLFNTNVGLWVNYFIKIQFSTPYAGSIEHWVILLCQGIQHILGHSDLNIQDILRVLTGAPVVKVHGVNLRAVKRVVYEGSFMDGGGKKGIVICSKEEDNGELDFCELLSFEKDADFLKSRITFRTPPTSQVEKLHPKALYFSKTYEQFVLGYQNFLYLLYNPGYWHRQIKQRFSKMGQKSVENQQQINGVKNDKILKIVDSQLHQNRSQKMRQKVWYVCIKITENNCHMFVQFCEVQKLSKQNYILLVKGKVQQREQRDERGQRERGQGQRGQGEQGEQGQQLVGEQIRMGQNRIVEDGGAMGELRKKGNFFFELNLEVGFYIFKIFRHFREGEQNSIHFYSSQQIQIISSLCKL